jgi:chitinase
VIFTAVMAVAACDLSPPAADGRQAEVNRVDRTHRWFGGYLDVTQIPGLRLADSAGHGTVTTVLSFINADPAKPCEPSWGGYYDLQQAQEQLDLDGQVAGFRRAGNDVAVSFGGQLGMELAAACSDSDALVTGRSSRSMRWTSWTSTSKAKAWRTVGWQEGEPRPWRVSRQPVRWMLRLGSG